MRRYLEDVAARAVWETCPNCAREWNALPEGGVCITCIEDAQSKAERQRKLGEYLLKTIGPYGCERYTFSGFNVTPENEYAFQRCQAFDASKHNLFVYGACGTGKTHLAGALLKAVCASNLTVRWGTPIYFSRALRSRFPSDEEAYVSWLVAHNVLIIDDLGAGRDTETTLKLIYEITDHRLHHKKNGLVITSNLSLDELAHNYKDDRIASRIAGLCEIIKIGGPDGRQER